MAEQDAKLALIEMRLQEFCEQFLSEEALPCLVALWEAAEDCRQLNLTGGSPDSWAAAIAYAFARMNFLLDDDGPMHIDRKDFFAFFDGCSRSTVTQKATRIEKALDFHYGHPDFCLPEVIDAMPQWVQLPNGMIVPERFLESELNDERKVEVGFLSDEESEELERQLDAQQRDREEEKARKRHENLRRQREEERKTQPDLFDPGE